MREEYNLNKNSWFTYEFAVLFSQQSNFDCEDQEFLKGQYRLFFHIPFMEYHILVVTSVITHHNQRKASLLLAISEFKTHRSARLGVSYRRSN
ncbi:hypothetical protein L1887_10759 [Cichorium endivia]|nr:hypothetical protein L1887_10759 [Cichorium endivia]